MDGGYVTWPALLCLAQHSWLMVSAAMVMMVADSPPHAFLEIPGIGPVLNIVYFMKYLPVWGVSSWLWLLLHIRKFLNDWFREDVNQEGQHNPSLHTDLAQLRVSCFQRLSRSPRTTQVVHHSKLPISFMTSCLFADLLLFKYTWLLS